VTTGDNLMTTSGVNLNSAEKLGGDNHDNLNRVSPTRIGSSLYRSWEMGGEVVTVVIGLEKGRARGDNLR